MKKYLVVLLVSLGLQAQTPIDNCDSLSWSQYPVTGLSITLDTTGAGTSSYGVDSIEVMWTACNSTQCYSAPIGMTGYFPQVSLSDTLKVCFDVWFYSTTFQGAVFYEFCSQCDSIIHDGTSWVLFNIGNPTGLPGFVIEEEGVRWWNDVIYDMQGRELKEIPLGQMYIRGGKINLRRK
jgi:hypothetical protein